MLRARASRLVSRRATLRTLQQSNLRASTGPRATLSTAALPAKGKWIGSFPQQPLMNRDFPLRKGWTSSKLTLDEVTGRFSPPAAAQMDAFVRARCQQPGATEQLIANGLSDAERKQLNLAHAELCKMSDLVTETYGFLVVKAPVALPPHTAEFSAYTSYSSVLLSSLLGTLIPQDGTGRKFIGVFNREGGRTMKEGARYHQTRQGGSLHTDNVASINPWDLLFMSCVSGAKVGGESIMCSAVTLHNFLRKEAPDVLETLCQPFIWECRGFAADEYFMAPIFWYRESRSGQPEPAIRYLRDYLESAAVRYERPLTDRQKWAFDALDAAMDMSAHQFRFFLEPGDHLVTSATQVLHGRTGFVDFLDDGESKPAAPAPAPVGASGLQWAPPRNRFICRSWISFPSTLKEGYRFAGSSPSRRLQLVQPGAAGQQKRAFSTSTATAAPGSSAASLKARVARDKERLAARFAQIASSGQQGVIVFDKDGTLFSFWDIWGAWAENVAARIQTAAASPAGCQRIRNAVYQSLGYDQQTRRPVSDKAPLAWAPMPHIRDLLTKAVAAELLAAGRASSPADAGAKAAAALAAGWTEQHDPAQLVPLADLAQALGAVRSGQSKGGARGFKTAVCTNDTTEATHAALRHGKLDSLFDYVVCGDDKRHAAKPSRETGLAICAAVGAVPAASFMVGDTNTDIVFGQNSGLETVGVLSGVGSLEALFHANYLLDSVADVAHAAQQAASSASAASASAAASAATQQVQPTKQWGPATVAAALHSAAAIKMAATAC